MDILRENNPLVSIIVLTLNQTDITCEFLESTRKLTYKNYELLVCDMGSEVDPTEEISSKNFPNTKVLRSEINRGCAGGRNWGVKQAKGDYVFLVDNDTIVTPNLIEALLEPFFKNPDVVVCCPKIRFYHNPEVIQYAGFNPINPFTGRNSAVGSNQVDKGQHDDPNFTFSSHGCASMIKKEIFNKVGYYPEKFFFYYEEMDWSARVKKAGYKIYYQPKGLIFHKQSMTLGLQSPKKLYYMTRNRILYMRRNTRLGQFLVFACFFTFVSIPKGIITHLSKGQFQHLKSFIKGVLWNVTTSKHSVV
jgi:GT2 family glycosyltransferase